MDTPVKTTAGKSSFDADRTVRASRRSGVRHRLSGRIGASMVAAAAVLSLGQHDSSASPTNITDAEMAVLPKYCNDAQTFHGYGGTPDSWSPNAPKWIALMGKGFLTIHHYCWALIDLMRIQKPGVPEVIKLGTRQQAVRDLSFVIENSPANFIMLPEIYTKMGDVQLSLKAYQDAYVSYGKARSLKRDYWPAYFRWAEFLSNAGRKPQAKALVAEGLSYSPDSRPLRDLYRQLGGDPQSVKPHAQGAPPQSSPSDADSSAPTDSAGERSSVD